MGPCGKCAHPGALAESGRGHHTVTARPELAEGLRMSGELTRELRAHPARSSDAGSWGTSARSA